MKKIYFYSLLFLLSALTSSCDDFFEIKRPQETQWTTTSTFEQGLSAAYWKLQWGSNGRGYHQYVDFTTSGTAYMLEGTSVGVPYNQLYNRSFEQKISTSKDVWTQAFQIVTMCNLALDLDKEKSGNPFNLSITGDDYKYNYRRQIGEYYFLRGCAYFYLIRYFAKPYVLGGDNSQLAIPLKTTAAYSKEDVFNEELGSIEDVYKQIIEDLTNAKNILPEKFTKNDWNNVIGYECGRANKLVASSLLGKVQFLMGNYSKAKEEFDYVIQYAEQTGTYKLEEPKTPFIKENPGDVPKESIWEFNSGQLNGASEKHNMYMYYGMIMGLRFRDSNGSEYLNVPETGSGVVMSGWNVFTMGYWALKQMDWMKDPQNGDYTITDKAKSDLRYQQVYYLLQPYKAGIKKGDADYMIYESVSGHSQVKTPHVYLDKFFRGEKPYGRYSKFPLIRLADIYLLRSWLRWKAGDTQGAATDLNLVWNRSNPNNKNIYTASNVNQTTIFNEYLREMSGEGWTVDFMKATQMAIPTGDNTLIKASTPPYAEWFWPIPDEETSLNPDYQK